MRKTLCAIIFLCAIVGASGARAKLVQHPRECSFAVGPAQMMFNAIQEEKTGEVFCRHIPDLGATNLIFDALQGELRELTVELLLLRDVGQKAWNDNLDANLVAQFPSGKHLEKNGTMTFRYDFTKDGAYLAVVRAFSEDGDKDYVGQYPFSIGETLETYIAAVLIFFSCGFVAFGLWRRRPASPRL